MPTNWAGYVFSPMHMTYLAMQSNWQASISKLLIPLASKVGREHAQAHLFHSAQVPSLGNAFPRNCLAHLTSCAVMPMGVIWSSWPGDYAMPMALASCQMGDSLLLTRAQMTGEAALWEMCRICSS